jgi:hypothetical protein
MMQTNTLGSLAHFISSLDRPAPLEFRWPLREAAPAFVTLFRLSCGIGRAFESNPAHLLGSHRPEGVQCASFCYQIALILPSLTDNRKGKPRQGWRLAPAFTEATQE